MSDQAPVAAQGRFGRFVAENGGRRFFAFMAIGFAWFVVVVAVFLNALLLAKRVEINVEQLLDAAQIMTIAGGLLIGGESLGDAAGRWRGNRTVTRRIEVEEEQPTAMPAELSNGSDDPLEAL